MEFQMEWMTSTNSSSIPPSLFSIHRENNKNHNFYITFPSATILCFRVHKTTAKEGENGKGMELGWNEMEEYPLIGSNLRDNSVPARDCENHLATQQFLYEVLINLAKVKMLLRKNVKWIPALLAVSQKHPLILDIPKVNEMEGGQSSLRYK